MTTFTTEQAQMVAVGIAYTPASPGFGTALRTYRTRARLSQSQLARQCGYDRSFLTRLESGDRSPTREVVDALSQAMGLTPLQSATLMAHAGLLPELLTVSDVIAMVVAKEVTA